MSNDREILLVQVKDTRKQAKELREQEEELIRQFRQLPEEVERQKQKEERQKLVDEKNSRSSCRFWSIYGLLHIATGCFTGLLYLGIKAGIAIPLPLARVSLLLTAWPIVFIVSTLVVGVMASGAPDAGWFFVVGWFWICGTSVPADWLSAPPKNSPPYHAPNTNVQPIQPVA